MHSSRTLTGTLILAVVVTYSLSVGRAAAQDDGDYHNLQVTTTVTGPMHTVVGGFPSSFFTGEQATTGITVKAGTPNPTTEEQVLSGPFYQCSISDVKYKTSSSGTYIEASSGDYAASTVQDGGASSGSFTLFFTGYRDAFWQVTVSGYAAYGGIGPSGPIGWDNADAPSTAQVPVFVTGNWSYSNPDPSLSLPPGPLTFTYTYSVDSVGIDSVNIYTEDWNTHPDWVEADISGGPANSYLGIPIVPSEDTIPMQANQGQIGRKWVWAPAGSTPVATNIDWNVSADAHFDGAVNAATYDTADYSGSTSTASGNGSVKVNATVGGSQALSINPNLSMTDTGTGAWTWSFGASFPAGVSAGISQPPAGDFSSSGSPDDSWPFMTGSGVATSAVAVTATEQATASVYWWSDPTGPTSSKVQASVVGGTGGITISADPQIPRAGGS